MASILNSPAAAYAMASFTKSLMDQVMPTAGRAAGQYITGSARPSNATQPSYSGGTYFSVPTTKKRKGRKKKKKTRKSLSIPSNISDSSSQRIRVCLRDAFTVSVTAGGTYDNYYQLANNFTASHDFATWLPRAYTISGVFRFFKVNSLKLTYQPYCASTASGYIAIGVDPDPSAVAPGGLGNVIRHNPSNAGDIKDVHTIMWTPDDNTEALDHLTNGGAVVTSPEHICQASIQIYASTSLSSVPAGLLFYEVDIEFFGLL